MRDGLKPEKEAKTAEGKHGERVGGEKSQTEGELSEQNRPDERRCLTAAGGECEDVSH